MKISVAGTGYVGMSIATLLAQHNEVNSQLSTIDCQMWQCQTYDKSILNSLYIEKFLYFCKKF